MNRLLSLCTLAVAACATSKETPQADLAEALNRDTLLLTALPDSALPKGKCGMILWTLESERPSPVLRYVAGEKAEIAINGAPAALTLEDVSGASGFGVFESQTFTNEAGLSAAVTFRFGLGFDGGSYLERGLISVEADNGWRIVAPAAGIAGCRR